MASARSRAASAATALAGEADAGPSGPGAEDSTSAIATFSLTAEPITSRTTSANAGNKTLASGAYLVASVPTPDTFTLTGAVITTGDSFNYLAKVNSTSGAIPF